MLPCKTCKVKKILFFPGVRKTGLFDEKRKLHIYIVKIYISAQSKRAHLYFINRKYRRSKEYTYY